MELSGPARLLNERPRYFWAQVIRVFIAKGWNPPKPNAAVANAVAMDVRRVSQLRRGWNRDMTPTLRLTAGEERCLTLFAEGYSVHEVAAMVGVGSETIKGQSTGMRRKLGAKNTAHAVALAFREGLLK